MDIFKQIEYCREIINSPMCVWHKLIILNKRLTKMQQELASFQSENETFDNSKRQEDIKFTLEELSKYDGSMGRPAYIAINGTVYDVSWSPQWAGGTHFGIYAGKDQSAEFNKCHDSSMEVLKNLPVVGKIK